MLGSHIMARGGASRGAAIGSRCAVASCSCRLAVPPGAGMGCGHLLLRLLGLLLAAIGRDARLLLLAIARLLLHAEGGGNRLCSSKRTIRDCGSGLLAVCCRTIRAGLGCLLSWHCGISTLLLRLLQLLGRAVRAPLLLLGGICARLLLQLLLLLASVAACGSAGGGLCCC